MRVIVDSSVAAKWAIGEGDSALAAALIPRHELVVPDLLFAEVSNILWKAFRRGELSETEVKLGAVLIRDMNLDVVATRTLLADATHLALQLDHPAYDCVYLALAQSEGIPLVTGDIRLLNKLARSGLAIRVMALADAAASL